MKDEEGGGEREGRERRGRNDEEVEVPLNLGYHHWAPCMWEEGEKRGEGRRGEGVKSGVDRLR